MTGSLLPDELVALARRVVDENAAIGRQVAVAESCTGGLVTAALSEISGCSSVLERGFVVYSNEAKREMLGVAHDLMDTFGAVSIAVAWAMAKGAIEHSQADVAVAITGVAGPDGGTEQKPVGTVIFAVAKRGSAEACNTDQKQFDANGTRADVRLQAAVTALELLLP